MSASSKSLICAVVLTATGWDNAYKYSSFVKYRWTNAHTPLAALQTVPGPVLKVYELDKPIDMASIMLSDYPTKFEHLQRSYLELNAALVASEATFQELGLTQPQAGSLKVTFVFVVQPPTSDSRALDIIADEGDVDRATVLKAIQGSDTPSNGARLGNMIRTQVLTAPEVLFNNRPFGLSPRPVAIYNRALATLRNDLLIVPDRSTFSPKELERASKVIEISLNYYPEEHNRMHELSKWFTLSGQPAWVVYELVYSATRDPVWPDGCFRLRNAKGVWVYPSIHEGKVEEGEGGCSAIAQAQKSYQKTVASDDYTSIRAVSCCPSVLLGLQGPNLTVSGAVFTDHFFVQQFGVLYLGPQLAKEGRSDLEEGILQTAKYLRALDRAVFALGEYYLDLPPPPASSQRESLSPAHFPYRDSFTAKGTTHHLTYTRHLTPKDIYKTLFAATMECDSNKTDVVVKFSYSYSPAAHELLAKNGFAPKLFYHELDKDMQMWMIVMEHVKGDSWPLAPSRGAKDNLEKAVEILHDAGYVHGDLRQPNVLVKGDEIEIIDFDWCGTAESESWYPVDMNTYIEWHAQAKPGSLIKKEHDLHCLESLLGRK